MKEVSGTSQHEQALSDAVRVLAAALLELGAAGVLRARLTALRHTTLAAGNSSGVEILDHLIDDLFPPCKTPPKPTFRIV